MRHCILGQVEIIMHCHDFKISGPYRYIRIAQNGKNASNQNHYLSLSGFEIYGDVVDVVVSVKALK